MVRRKCLKSGIPYQRKSVRKHIKAMIAAREAKRIQNQSRDIRIPGVAISVITDVSTAVNESVANVPEISSAGVAGTVIDDVSMAVNVSVATFPEMSVSGGVREENGIREVKHYSCHRGDMALAQRLTTPSPQPGCSFWRDDGIVTPARHNKTDTADNAYEDACNDKEIVLQGRRLIDINYFFKCILNGEAHEPFGCSIKDMVVVHEKRTGLKSTFTLKCKMCNIKSTFGTEDPEGASEMDVNDATVFATVSTGCGFAQLTEQHAILNMPSLSFRKYSKHHDNILGVLQRTAWKTMEEAGMEEARLAQEEGQVNEDGYACVTVVADGAWSKRSYKVNYDAASGVACIIGARTGKLLFLGVRNKYCAMCARAANKQITATKHICYKNWTGTSTAMEADIIVEGFLKSMEMHKLKYTTLVGDGDSSVYRKLIETRPYGANTIVKKIECKNHLLRNYCTNLKQLVQKRFSSAQKFVAMKVRKLLEKNIFRLRTAIKCAVNYHRKTEAIYEEQVTNIVKDIKNSPHHVFGNHAACADYYCKGASGTEVNYIPELEECGLLADIAICGNRLIRNVCSLILNMDTNLAELYNSVVCKFIGGKRINFSQTNSYELRCNAAAISYNAKTEYYSMVHRAMTKRSPGSHTKVFAEKRFKKIQNSRSKRKLFKKKKTQCAPPDKDYGLDVMNDEDSSSDNDLQKDCDDFLRKLQKTTTEITHIEKQTRGQHTNKDWRQERLNKLTASVFGKICKMRLTTSCANTVKNILYSQFSGSAATNWGLDHEPKAISDFEVLYDLSVTPCGFFIDHEVCFLGASPDGLIGDDSIIEVKCPFAAATMTPEDAIASKKVSFASMEHNTFRLKKCHNYMYQVQGQLHITRRQFCYFVFWTPLGMLVDKISKDDNFWETKMMKKLQDFYKTSLLPEIVDPKFTKGKKIRTTFMNL